MVLMVLNQVAKLAALQEDKLSEDQRNAYEKWEKERLKTITAILSMI